MGHFRESKFLLQLRWKLLEWKSRRHFSQVHLEKPGHKIHVG